MPRRGRPTKLTPELQKRITDYIKAGYTIEQACALAGIGKTTFYRWKRRGEQSKSGKYHEFWNEAQTAQEIAKAKLISVILKAAKKGEWRAAKWYLSRIDPERFGKKDYVRQDIRVEGKIKSLKEELKEAEEYFKKIEEKEDETES